MSSKLPKAVQDAVFLIQSVLTDDLLSLEWRVKAKVTQRKYTVHCVNASGALWYLAGGGPNGWRYFNIPQRAWGHGPHYFLRHIPTDTLVDATVEQFAGLVIPYDLAEGRAPPTRGKDSAGLALPPKNARTVVQRVLALPECDRLIGKLREWSRTSQKNQSSLFERLP